MTKHKHGFGFFFGIGFIILLIAAIVWFCCCLSLAFKDNYADKYTLDATDDGLISEILIGDMFGIDTDITETQLNTYINKTFCTSDTEEKNSVQHIRIYFHKNEPSEIYAKIRLYSYELAIYTKAEFNFEPSDNTLSIRLSNAKIGELSIPDFILSNVLSKTLENKEKISVNGTTLSVKTSYEYEIKDSYSVTILLEKFEVQESYVSCRTNNLSEEALDLLNDYLSSDEGKQYFKDFLTSDIDFNIDIDTDSIKNNLHELFS